MFSLVKQNKKEGMISNKNYSNSINDVLEFISNHGLEDLNKSLQNLFNELMKIEREQVLQAERYERSELRKGYCNGYKNKTLQTRLGPVDLDVPQTRGIDFYPSCLEKGERTERALKLAIAEMYVTGVSTRRVKAITEELCGMEISSTQVSRMAKLLDTDLEKFRTRELGTIKYLYLDADYQKVRHEGSVRSLAVLKAVGVTNDGYREILGISCSLSEAEVHWRSFLESLLKRGLRGIELVISDSHAGLKAALQSVLPSVPWQRCIFHLAQNAQQYAPNNSMRGEIAQAVRDIYQSLSPTEARQRLKEVVERYEGKAKRFVEWLELNFEEGLTYYKFPRSHWRKIRTVNMVERLNREVKRRTRVAQLFPNVESCERLITSVAMDVHEDWVSGKKYVTIE